MAIKLTDQEQNTVKAEYMRLLPTTGNMKFPERFALANRVLPEDRRLTAKYPSVVKWLGVGRTNGSAEAGTPAIAVRKTKKTEASAPAMAPNAGPSASAGDVLETFERFGEALSDFVMAKVAVKLEACGGRFQEKTVAAETQLRKLRDVRRDLIAAKARGDGTKAEALERELESLQAWAATGSRAAAEVGA